LEEHRLSVLDNAATFSDASLAYQPQGLGDNDEHQALLNSSPSPSHFQGSSNDHVFHHEGHQEISLYTTQPQSSCNNNGHDGESSNDSSQASQSTSASDYSLSPEEIEGFLDGNWSRRFFFDYILVEGKAEKADYSSIIPTSSAIHFEYIMKPHKENANYPLFATKGAPGKTTYSFHDGMTNLSENVWWVIEVERPGVGPSGSFERFPSDLAMLFNTVKFKTFSR
jgi:hypothetical protein